jgi:hypothetical protein
VDPIEWLHPFLHLVMEKDPDLEILWFPVFRILHDGQNPETL